MNIEQNMMDQKWNHWMQFTNTKSLILITVYQKYTTLFLENKNVDSKIWM